MPFNETEQLTQLMTRRHECLGQLCELGRRQLELIASGDLGTLLKVLSVKQRLLVNLQAIERELDPYRDQSPETRVWQSTADREHCLQLAAQCQIFLREIVQQEKQSERDLIEHRDDAASRLQGAHTAAQACGAYAADVGALSGHLDLSCDQ